jgi:Tfp pilus assembly protein PilO
MVEVKANLKLNFLTRAVVLIVTFALVLYAGNRLNKETKLISTQKQTLAGLNHDLEMLDKILSDRQNYEADILTIKNSLPSSYYEVSFFTSQIERLAQVNGLQLETTIDPNVKEEKGGFSSLKFTLNTKGGYQSYSRFLSALTNLPYHTKIDSIKVAKQEGILAQVTIFRLFVNK